MVGFGFYEQAPVARRLSVCNTPSVSNCLSVFYIRLGHKPPQGRLRAPAARHHYSMLSLVVYVAASALLPGSHAPLRRRPPVAIHLRARTTSLKRWRFPSNFEGLALGCIEADLLD